MAYIPVDKRSSVSIPTGSSSGGYIPVSQRTVVSTTTPVTAPIQAPEPQKSFFGSLVSGVKSIFGGNEKQASTSTLPVTTKPAVTTPKSGYIPVSERQAKPSTGYIPVSERTVKPITTSPNYFSTTTPSGATIGYSLDQKDLSGKPLFAYRNPGDTATTTDKTRVATTFDPMTPKPLTREEYYNPRAEGLRETFKKATGITPSQELDHAIALTVGGSNLPENLRAIPTEENKKYGEFEAQLAQQLKEGKISYFEAQVADAKQKGITPPWTPEQVKAGIPNMFEQTWNKVKDVLPLKIGTKQQQNISEQEQKPLTVGQSIGGFGSRVSKLYNTVIKNITGFEPGERTPVVDFSRTKPVETEDWLNNESKRIGTESIELKNLSQSINESSNEEDISLYNNRVDKYNADLNKLQQSVRDYRIDFYKKNAEEKFKEFEKASDPLSISLKAVASVPMILWNFAAGLKQSVESPSEGQKSLEQEIDISMKDSPLAKNFIAPLYKAVSRTVNALLPLNEYAQVVSQNFAAGEAYDKGLTIKQVEELYPAIKKTNLQIAGDILNTAGSIYFPNIFAKGLSSATNLTVKQSIMNGMKQSIPMATTFAAGTVMSSGTKDPVEATAMFSETFLGLMALGAITHSAIPLGKEVTNRLTKDIIETHNLPKTLTLKPGEIKDFVTSEQSKLINSLGLSKEEYINAFKNGLSIEIPTEKLISQVDKPWFSKVKQAVGIKSEPNIVSQKYITPIGQEGAKPTKGVAGLIEAPKETGPISPSILESKPTIQEKPKSLFSKEGGVLDNTGRPIAPSFATPTKEIAIQPDQISSISADVDAIPEPTAKSIIAGEKAIEQPTVVSRRTIFNRDIQITPEVATKLVFNGVNPKDLKLFFTNEKIDGATGSFEQHPVLGNIIKLYKKNGKVGLIDALHESKHFLVSRLPKEIRDDAFAIARKEIGPLTEGTIRMLYPKKGVYAGPTRTEAILEEYIVDKWSKSDASQMGYKKSVYGKIFEALDNLLKRFMDTVDKVKEAWKKIPNKQGGFARTPDFEGRKDKVIPSNSKKATPNEIYRSSIEADITKAEEAIEAEKAFNQFHDLIDEKKYQAFEQLKTRLEILQENQRLDNAGKLTKYLKEGKLPEVTGKKGSKFGMMGDEFLDELGYKSKEAAQEAIDKYKENQKTIDEIKSELRANRPFIKNRKETLDYLERQDKLNLKAQKEFTPTVMMALELGPQLRDISSFEKGMKDLWRVFEKVFGPNYEQAKTLFLDKFDEAKGNYIDTTVKLTQELETMLKKYNIPAKKGTIESQYIMDYGEGEISYEEVVTKFGPGKAEQIKNATEWFRTKYDELIDRINKVRKELYPNNPEKLIQKRKDYFRHYQELTEGLEALKNIFETPAGISPSLAGLSDFTSPRTKFLSFAQARLGIKTRRDAVGGYINYIPSASYSINIDPQISAFRKLRKGLVTATEESRNINNFIEYLHDFANDLAGKTNPLDRAVQKYMPGGRKTFAVINWVNNRIKANTILGNVRSSLAQAFNIPQGVGSAKLYSVPGATRTFGQIFAGQGPMSKSIFIKERYHGSYFNKFEPGILKKTQQFAAWMTGVMDEVGTKFIWNSHYEKAVAQKIQDPIKYADDMTRKMVAGRGIGEVPAVQKARITQVFMPFQLEVTNLWYVMGDMVKARDLSGLVILLVASYLMNEVMRETTGSDVSFDPINATIEGIKSAKEEQDTGRAIGRAGGRIAGEIVSNIPGGQYLATLYPEKGFNIGGSPFTRNQLFGEGDPTRFGGSILTLDALKSPETIISRIGFPFAGGQILKSYKGISALTKGQVETGTGKLKTEIKTTPMNVAKGVLFGPGAFKESIQKSDETVNLMNKLDTQANMAAKQTELAEKEWERLTKLNNEIEFKDEFTKISESNPNLAKKLITISQEQAAGLTLNDRLIKQLGVENGSRAEYIAKKLKEAKNEDEFSSIWNDFVNKKIITKDVAKQINDMLNQ